jgi:hypothetical protein
MPIDLTPKLLADATLQVLGAEEAFLKKHPVSYSTRKYRECYVQFLLWRELVGRGYNAETEDGYIDVTIRRDQLLVSAIELKGPWNVREAGFPTDCIRAASQDFRKHLDILARTDPVQCYSVWVLHGSEEARIQDTFLYICDSALREISPTLDRSCLDYDPSLSMPLNTGGLQQVFAVQMKTAPTP